MTKEEFHWARKKIAKTQKELASLLAVSIKTIHSYEQGWRTIPLHIERHLYFLVINQRGKKCEHQPCWEIQNCTQKGKCPAWEFQSGHLCWFLNGTLCDCAKDFTQKDKLEICKTCDIFRNLLQ